MPRSERELAHSGNGPRGPAFWLMIALTLSVPALAFGAAEGSLPESRNTTAHNAWEVLVSATRDHNAIHRQKALTAFSTLPPWSSAVKVLEKMLQHDEDGGVRAAAATALGHMNARRTAPTLRAALDDKEVSVRFAAAQSLWRMHDHSGRDILLNVLEGETFPGGGINQMIRQQWDEATGKLHDPQALAWMGAEEASGALLGPFAIGVTMAEQLTKDKGAPARVLSASMLASDRDPRTVRDLDESLGDTNWVVRAALNGTHLRRGECELLHGTVQGPVARHVQQTASEKVRGSVRDR